ncbi:hypothetical protein [Flavobacterium sp. KACC 22763]|uniref:hypothetical protein n=1 Tax=Flavobacterium sp. KACC 22763 TaxID=3025668 RepID=UPI002366B68B|nr:hypothetical protein [Flavobacterium sp. KACC 22763]WDF65355.1 hypothetical protein PQ463_04145 [Flavobacterium sp. KACC 22763]
MYFIMICEYRTGIILELDCKTRFNDFDGQGNIPRLSFFDLESAEKKAVELIKSNNELEVSIVSENDVAFSKRLSYKDL